MQAHERVSQSRTGLSRVFYGWYIVAAGMGIHLWISIAWIYGMQIFFNPIIGTFAWSRAAVSGAFALQRLEGSIASPIEGFLIDKFGPRIIVLIGVLITGFGLMFMSMIQSLWMFYMAVLVISLGTSASSGMTRNWAIVQWFRRMRGRALGIGASGAVLSGPMLFIVIWLLETLGWRLAFIVLGIITWLICIPLGFVFRGRPQEYGYFPDGDLPMTIGEKPSHGIAGQKDLPIGDSDAESMTVRQALRTRVFWILTLVFGAQTVGVSGLMVHLIPYFESIGFSTNQAASVLGLFTLLSAIGRLGGGWAMDYFNQRAILAIILVLQAVAFLIMANITSYWQVLPFAMFYGTAFGGMMPARGVIISTYFGTRHFGAIQGLSQSATVLGGMAGPILMGWMFDTTQSYIMSIYILAAVVAAAVPLTMFARPPGIPQPVSNEYHNLSSPL